MKESQPDSMLPIPIERLEHAIIFIRGQKVMLDSDLAKLYGVGTRNLNKAVKRNIIRFPADFMFRLSDVEAKSLMFQNGTSKKEHRGGRRKLPYVFTEQGVAMLSSVLKSERAALVNIAIMRTFVCLREMIASNVELSHKLDKLDRKVSGHDADIQALITAIRKLMAPPTRRKGKMGFQA